MEAFKLLASRPTRVVYEKIQGKEVHADSSLRPVPFFLTNCFGSNFDLSPAKATQITVERCQDLRLKISSSIGSIELISSQNITIEFTNEEGASIVMDSCSDSVLKFKSIEQLKNSLMITSNCRMIEINAETEEEIVPDSINSSECIQLRTVYKEGKFQTEMCNNYGDALS
jgi:hypothetical protein